jgi:CheY-like chemotaxis protein
MSRILLVDDSPHAQRIGERILTDEGFEVVTVSNADTALVRIEDVDPDVVIADAVMPGRTGYEICQYLKMSPRHRHVRVILTAGVLEPIDEAQAQRVGADSSLKKPFEASALVNAVRPLADAAARDRKELGLGGQGSGVQGRRAPSAAFVAVVDEEQVRAAVTIALDASMDAIVSEIARRVVASLQSHPPEAGKTAAAPESPKPAAKPEVAQTPPLDPATRANPLRKRASILGVEADKPAGANPESRPPSPDPE